jgi:hypothetical protein
MGKDVQVTVGAETSALNTGLAKAKESVTGFKNHVAGQMKEVGKGMLAAFAVGAIVEGIKSIFDEFGKFQDLADKFGVPAEALQRISLVAQGAGADLEGVMKALSKGKKNAVEAAAGNEELAAAYAALGATADDFKSMAPDDLLVKLSEGYVKSGESAEYLAAATKVLGKSGQDTFAILSMGPEALREELDSAAVASNEAIASIDEAGDNAGKAFQQLKVWGAEAINFIIKGMKEVGAAIAVVVAYLSNLGSGFKAAKEAAKDAMQAWQDIKKEEAQEREEKSKRKAELAQRSNDKADRAEEKKAEKELAKLKEENTKKEHDAYMRSLSLLEKKAELEKEIEQQKAESESATNSPVEREQAKGKVLDLQKEQESVNKEIAKEDAKAAEERAKAAAKKAKEGLKGQLDDRKKALKDAEENLRDASKEQAITVDSLRQIGGGLKGVNYNAAATKDALQKQQVDLARVQVDKLTAIVAAIEAQQKQLVQPDGSFGDE